MVIPVDVLPCHLECCSGAPQRAVRWRHRVGVALQLLQRRCQRELGLAERHEEAAGRGLCPCCARPLRRPPRSQLLRDLLAGVLLGAAEDVALGALREAELVHMHMPAKGDEAHMDVLGQRRDGLHDCGLACIELILAEACVDHEQVDRWVWLHRPVQSVLDGAV